MILICFFFYFSLFNQIATVEIIRSKLNLDSENQVKVFNQNLPNWVQNGYKYIGLFGFGAACSQLATDIGKYSIGRLRPHFFDVSIKTMFFYVQFITMDNYIL